VRHQFSTDSRADQDYTINSGLNNEQIAGSCASVSDGATVASTRWHESASKLAVPGGQKELMTRR